MLTEEQARTKWCPHSRYNSNGELASNRWKQSLPEDQPHALNPIPCRCIASECMAWRWMSRHECGAQDSGYCGLAGEVTP